jgi:hypothetical protein
MGNSMFINTLINIFDSQSPSHECINQVRVEPDRLDCGLASLSDPLSLASFVEVVGRSVLGEVGTSPELCICSTSGSEICVGKRVLLMLGRDCWMA